MRVVAVDFDSTLQAILPRILVRLNREKGTRYRLEDITSWDWFQEAGLPFKDFMAEVRAAHRDLHTPAMPGAQEAMWRLYQHPAVMAFVLSNNQAAEEEYMAAWLQHNGFPPMPIVLTGGNDKTEYDFDVLVDDDPRIEDDEGLFLYRYPQPYNDSEFEGWGDIVEDILGDPMLRGGAAA